MARYYFNLFESGSSTKDIEGRILGNHELAKGAALRDARAIMCEDILRGSLSLSAYIDVMSDEGERVMRVRFKDAITISGL